ncbi:MAG: PD-(D/E)XK nuclease family protein [Candidatus Pacebacteria bacterium]|nr:PD-(D/E)XK nuclease family protein [Candidatus Paceibacterota bacterium]
MTIQSASAPTQLAFEIIKPKRGKTKPAICYICGKFHPDCFNIHYSTATGRKSKKKARICPDCSDNPVRYVVGSGLSQIGPTTIAASVEVCPMKAMLQSGPKGVKVSLPLNDWFVVGMAAHFGWAMLANGNYEERTICGQRGIQGYVGNLILDNKKRSVTVELVCDAQELTRQAIELVLYAKKRSLIKTTSIRLEHEKKLIFAQTEARFRITLKTLLQWAGVEWNTIKAPVYNCVFQAYADLVEVWKNEENGYIVRITDYKSFYPGTGSTQRYKKSLQLRIYGFWTAWAFGIPPEKLHKVQTRVIFIGKDNSEAINHKELALDSLPEDPLDALRQVWQFLSNYHQVISTSPKKQLEIATKFFPPEKGGRCEYCDFREKHCPAYKIKT